MIRYLSALFLLLLAVPVVAAEPAKTAVTVVCVDGENCAWLEPLGGRLARQLFANAKPGPFQVGGKDALTVCSKGMSPTEADACFKDLVRGAAGSVSGAHVVLHLWTENEEVVRGSAQIVMNGTAETANFTLVPVTDAMILRQGFGTPRGDSRFVLRGALGKAAVDRGLTPRVERIAIEVLEGVRIFGDLVVDAPVR